MVQNDVCHAGLPAAFVMRGRSLAQRSRIWPVPTGGVSLRSYRNPERAAPGLGRLRSPSPLVGEHDRSECNEHQPGASVIV